MGKIARGLAPLCGVALIVIGVLALFASPFTSTAGGEYAVVRNGGWLDNHEVRQIIPPGQGLTPSGWWSSVHRYPATQRNFVVSSAPNADSNEVITVPSKDGVQLGIEGTFYFQLTGDPAVLGQFDDRFGTRTYPVPGSQSGDTAMASDGDKGWDAFLAFTLGNLVQNDLRVQVAQYQCTQLIATCALAQNGAAVQAAATPPGTDQIAVIQDAVNASFQKDVTATLGGAYFDNIHFVLAKVTLPQPVQDAINTSQAAFAGVTKAQADLKAAQIEAQAAAAKQQGYAICSSCARQDENHSLPQGITVYAPGAPIAVGTGH